MIRQFTLFNYDTEELPNGDFVLYLCLVGMGPEFTQRFVNPDEDFLRRLIKYWKLTLPHQKYDFMRLYLYLSGLKFKRKGYRLWQ